MATDTIFEGKQLAAARVLAGLGMRELAAAAGVALGTLHRLEASIVIHVSETKQRGSVRRLVWEQITAALAAAGVELLPQGMSFGAGVRWTAPREHRQRERSRQQSGA
jgi:AcrR family transcriptional regulator